MATRLGANKKNIEGKSHPDRDAQFEHITATCQEFEQHRDPIISVDCKKKELLGQFVQYPNSHRKEEGARLG